MFLKSSYSFSHNYSTWAWCRSLCDLQCVILTALSSIHPHRGKFCFRRLLVMAPVLIGISSSLLVRGIPVLSWAESQERGHSLKLCHRLFCVSQRKTEVMSTTPVTTTVPCHSLQDMVLWSKRQSFVQLMKIILSSKGQGLGDRTIFIHPL